MTLRSRIKTTTTTSSEMKAEKAPLLGPSRSREHHTKGPRWTFLLIFITMLVWIFVYSRKSDPLSSEPLERLWAQYSPFFPVKQYVGPPEGCTVTQVNILQRHGARYPTLGAGLNIASAVTKLQSVQIYTDENLEFLRDYEYDLGTADLVPLGAVQSFEAGQSVYKRYAHLISEDNLPFVRASRSDRVIQSATNWTAGFSDASNNTYNPILSLTISEDKGANNTLDDNNCPNHTGSSLQTLQWLEVYAPPITRRLNEGAPGALLTDLETYGLMSLCAFDTVAHVSAEYLGEARITTYSPFCLLFTKEEFEHYQYSGDLDKYYNTGYGNPLGPIQGAGYVNELLARLTSTPVKDSTQTNSTLDSSLDTFPLNRTVYADFSHDNQLIPIYSVIGLFPQDEPLNPTKPQKGRTWKAVEMVPFAGRMVVEKVACAVKGKKGEEEYVRILVNDALQPLEFCGAKRGMCTLEAFIKSQSYARRNGDGDYGKCF